MKPFSKAIRTFHVWTGLTIGGLFCLMSLSGSVLVLRPAIEGLLMPAWTAKSEARPSDVLTEAAKNIAIRWPDARIESVSLPARSDALIGFVVRTHDEDELHVFVDARSGEVLGTFALPWLDWLTDLHHHVQLESVGGVKGVGKKIVGAIGIFLFLSSLAGLLLWAPRPTRWSRFFGLRCGMARQFNKFDLHRVVGVLGSAALLFISATGITIAFPQTVSSLLGTPPEAARPRLPISERRAPAGGVLPAAVQPGMEQYLSAARNAVPDGTVIQLRIPPNADRPVTVRLRLPGDIRQEGSARVSLDAETARVLAVDKPADWPLAKQIVQAATPLHYAEWGGMPLRVLWSFIGLIPPVLFVSGLLIWWEPIRARRSTARAAAARELEREEDLVA